MLKDIPCFVQHECFPSDLQQLLEYPAKSSCGGATSGREFYVVWTVWGIFKVCWSIATFVPSLPATLKGSSNPLSKNFFDSSSIPLHNTWENKNNCSYYCGFFFLYIIPPGKNIYMNILMAWFWICLKFCLPIAVFHQLILITHHTVIYITFAGNWLATVYSLFKYLTFINVVVLGVWITFFKIGSIHCLFLLHFS